MDTILIKEKLHKLIDESNDVGLLEKLEIILEESVIPNSIPMNVQEEIIRRMEISQPILHNALDIVCEFKEKYSKR